MTTQEIQDAIRAIKSGDKVRGRQLLVDVLKADPKNELAWLWLAGTLDDDKRRRDCLEQVLKINPENQAARRGLSMLQGSPEETTRTPRGKRRVSVFAVGSILLLLGVLITAGILWQIREQKTAIVPVDIASIIEWGMTDEQTVLGIGGVLQTRVAKDHHTVQIASGEEAYNRYVYWMNADTVGVEGYVTSRLPLSVLDVDLVKLQEAVLVFAYEGVFDLDDPGVSETRYVLAKLAVTSQNPVQFKIKDYKVQEQVPELACFTCLTYATEHCAGLPGWCTWIRSE